jgi:hypothetical protein
MTTSLTPTSTARIQGTILDTSGQTINLTPDPITATTTNAGSIPDFTIQPGTQVQVQAATAIGAIGIIVCPRTAGNPITVQGAVSDTGFQIPPGGHFLFKRTIGSTIYVTNPGSAAITVQVGAA